MFFSLNILLQFTSNQYYLYPQKFTIKNSDEFIIAYINAAHYNYGFGIEQTTHTGIMQVYAYA